MLPAVISLAHAEQPVAVQGRPRRRDLRPVRRGARNQAREVRRHRVAGDALRHRLAGQVGEAPSGRTSGRVQVARHDEGTVHLARDLRILGGRVVGHLRDRVLRGRALHLHVGHGGVAEAGERVVADRERPLGEVALAGDREVPGEVEAVAGDAGPLKCREQPLHVGPACLHGGIVRLQPVAVHAERLLRLDDLAVRSLQVPQRDDVVPALVEVDGRADDQVHVRGIGGIRVHLGPDQMAAAGVRVQHHDGLIGVVRALDVGDRHGAGAVERGLRVEAGHLGRDLLAGAEAVVAVPLLRLNRVARDVARHRQGVQVQAPARVGGGIGDREEVVRPRLQADGRVERVTSLLAGCGRSGSGHERDRHNDQCRAQPESVAKQDPLP